MKQQYQYTSPFTWRYGSAEMRHIFSEEYKFTIWRTIWVAVARAQQTAGLVTAEELKDLETHQYTVDIARIQEIERETKHDVVAAIKEYAEKATVGGGKIHLGATSMDIVDNTDMIRMKEGIGVIRTKLEDVIKQFAEKVDQYADLPCMAYTHLQPAEPTTVGYRFAWYAQDLLTCLDLLTVTQETVRGKGMKGAVGTAASYHALLKGTPLSVEKFEELVMNELGIKPACIASQVYPRQFDSLILSCLAQIASALAKFAGDLRVLQSPAYGEWSEPFREKQVGSSAMPFKRNPIQSEKICSLARLVTQLPAVSYENASLSYLERTLDDSANKRVVFPEAFLATDEILKTATSIITDMQVHEKVVARNLARYAPFAAAEALLMAMGKKGADRQKMHELLRDISMQAWEEVQNENPNPMKELLKKNNEIAAYLSSQEIDTLMDVRGHTGNAASRARKLVKEIRSRLL